MSCGSWAGYQAHWKAGEKACEPCLAAGRARAKEYYDRRGRELKKAQYATKKLISSNTP